MFIQALYKSLAPRFLDYKNSLRARQLSLQEIISALTAYDEEFSKEKVGEEVYVSEAKEGNSGLARYKRGRVEKSRGKGKGLTNDRRGPTCTNCGGRYHDSSVCQKPPVKCYKCGQLGHKRSTCPKRQDHVNLVTETTGHVSPLSDHGESVNVTEADTEMYTFDSEETDVAWYLDSGATSHVTNTRALFKSYSGLVYGYGLIVLRVRVPIRGSTLLHLPRVLYVPDVRKNLVSTYRLSRENMTIEITEYGAVLKHHGVTHGTAR
ncbi:hypothetical protein V1522DRAFT_359175, partial [Lipomyces starkeyi]